MIDRAHGNVVVCVFDYPAGWQADSAVLWNMQNYSVPMLCYGRCFDPQTGDCFEFFPSEFFCWIEPNYGFYQQGQNVFGQFCLPPMKVADTLVRWVVPRFRGDRPGLRIVGATPEPIAARYGIDLRGMPSEDARVTLEYLENGRLVQEEIYGLQGRQDVPFYGPMGGMVQINWGFPRLFSFRAEKGRLDSQRERFWQIARSLRANPAWEQMHGQILQQLKAVFDQYIQMGYNQIQAAAQLSQAISANNDAMLRNFEHQRQAAAQTHRSGPSGHHSPMDRFDEYIRGVETVEDPYWGESQQDSNYRYHWTDGFGNYQHSNDPFFNPSIGSNINWSLMPPVR
jgi:hypothetical protein